MESSPIVAAGRIYFQSEDGTTTVVKPGTTFATVGKNTVKGKTLASLAPIEGAIFLRTDKELLRIDAESK